MAVLVDVSGGRVGKESAQRDQPGLETMSTNMIRPIFSGPNDPNIAPWAAEAVRTAGGDAAKAQIYASVPVESAGKKKWDLNASIGQTMQDRLMELGVPEAKIHIFIEAMDFKRLSESIGNDQKNPAYWQSVQQRLTYATDEAGALLLESKKIGREQVQALLRAKTFDEFKNALASIGEIQVYFPNMSDDKTVIWLYDEMRKATVIREQKKIEAEKTLEVKKSVPVQLPFPKLTREYIQPVAPPASAAPPPKRPPPEPWDFEVKYAGGTPISTYPPGSILHPPLSAEGANLDTVNKVYTLNNLLGIHTPLQSFDQLKKDQEALRSGGMGAIFNDAYFGDLRQLPASYASRLMKELFDTGAQIKLGRLEERNKLYVFASIPMLPIRGTVPLMDNVPWALYKCNLFGAAWTTDWIIENWGNAELYAQTDIRIGMLYSDRSMSGSPPPKSFAPAAIGLDLMGNKTIDVLPDRLFFGMLDASVIYKRELSDKINVQTKITVRGVGSALSGGWPAAIFEGEVGLKKLIDGSFAALNGTTKFGVNIPAKRFEEISGYLVLKPKNGALPAVSAGVSETWPLKGSLTNFWAKLEETIKLSKTSSVGAYVKGGVTRYPRTSDLFSPVQDTNFEFGVTGRFVLDAPEQKGE